MSVRTRRGGSSIGVGISRKAAALTRTAALFAFLLSSSAASAATISGKVFEDVNYGGGAGRNWATASAIGGSARPAARVELFTAAGMYVTFMNTDGSGNYTFAGLVAGSYTLRVVSSSVSSSRTGYVAGLLPVLTFRTDASTGTAVGVTNHVGGHDPATADAGNAGAGWILNPATGVFSGSGAGKAHAFAPVTTSVPNVTGVDFGWNFDTVVNANSGGQGSLLQLLTNANTLGADASLTQSGRPAGIESALFMISNGTAVPGLRAINNYFVGGVATISPTLALPPISRPLILDAQLQPGWTVAAPVIRIDGASAGASNGLLLNITSDGSTIRGLMITRFSADGIHVQSGGDSITIAGNWIGTTGTGSTGVGNGDEGIEVRGSLAMIGGLSANDRNVITHNGDEGINIVSSGVSGHVIRGNFIGVDPDGASGGNGNGDVGIAIISGSGNRIGGTSAGARNVISKNFEGIEINTDDNVVQGNYIGTDVTGTLPRGNRSDDGVEIKNSATGNTIGGNASTEGNLIAFNRLDGVHVTNGSGNSVLGNSIHSNGGIGIDLNNDGVTVNNGTKNALSPNYDMDHPVFTGRVLTGTSLTVAGFVGSAPGQSVFANARVEVFESDDDLSGFGEGRTYLGFLTTDANAVFVGTLDVTGKGLVVGDKVTGTATDGINNTSEFGANATVTAPTAVSLLSFGARPRDAAVQLDWRTGSEFDNLGFHLYRSTSPAGPWERITTSLIPGLGSSPEGARYRYTETLLENGRTYFYNLEDIETTGRTEIHGPVYATPELGASTDESTPSSDDPVALIQYGHPENVSFRVLERGRRQVVLELMTEGFYAEAQPDGSVRIEIPGFVEDQKAGAPALPVKRTWLEAVLGRKVELISIQARDVVAFSLRPSAADIPEVVATRKGTVRARRRRARALFRGKGLYPEKPARVVELGFQGEAKKALVELAPLRWDGSTGQLLLAQRLTVRVAFRGRDRADARRGYQKPASHQKRGVMARLVTAEAGLHAVRFEDVYHRRVKIRADEIRLSRLGQEVAFHIEPEPERFRSGSVLYFVSEGAASNPYDDEAIYELEVGAAGQVMPLGTATPSGEPTSFYWERLEKEENRIYQAALLDAPDRWLWQMLLAPQTKSFPFEVDALASVSKSSRLEVWLMGGSDLPEAPDHHVRLYVNASLVEEVSWEGKKAHKVVAELPPGILMEGENLLEIDNVGDTGAAYSMVFTDRFSVSYPRLAVARAGTLGGIWGESGSGRSYLAVSADTVIHPRVRKASPSRLKKRQRADYLLIGPQAFLGAAKPLIEHRRRQGLEVTAVSIEQVYEEFGFGEPRPEAIKEFLSYAFHNWRKPSPRYVLLLGDGSYDFRDHLGTGVSNQVPPLMVKTSYLWTASDPAYASVNGEDLLPDVAIGRLPAATVAELETMVTKILAYENGQASLEGPVVLVADDPDLAGNFEANAEELAAGILASKNPQTLFLAQLGAAATTDAVLQSFDDGASLVSYIGHGGIHLWANENIFHTGHLSSLSLQAQQPLLLTMNCLNGYFHFPYFDSLAEALVKAEGKGAIAAFSPSGLSLNGPAHTLHKALLNEIVNGDHERLGDAVLTAQAAYAETGAFLELLSIYHLLGDPALRLQ